MPHGDLIDVKDQSMVRDRGELAKLSREHAMAVIRDYKAQPRMGELVQCTAFLTDLFFPPRDSFSLSPPNRSASLLSEACPGVAWPGHITRAEPRPCPTQLLYSPAAPFWWI